MPVFDDFADDPDFFCSPFLPSVEDFAVDGQCREGLADIHLINLGRELCFMTQAVYLGHVFSKGSFIRAGVQVKVGHQIQVKVERP